LAGIDPASMDPADMDPVGIDRRREIRRGGTLFCQELVADMDPAGWTRPASIRLTSTAGGRFAEARRCSVRSW
jgi:hypothetical protein